MTSSTTSFLTLAPAVARPVPATDLALPAQNLGTGASADIIIDGDATSELLAVRSVDGVFEGSLRSSRRIMLIDSGSAPTDAWGARLRTSSFAIGQTVVVRSASETRGGLIKALRPVVGQQDLVELEILPALGPELSGELVLDIDVAAFSTSVSKLAGSEAIDVSNAFGNAELVLNGVFSSLSVGVPVLIENQGEYIHANVKHSTIESYPLEGVSVPQTMIEVSTSLPQSWGNDDLVIWFSWVSAGQAIRIPKTSLQVNDLLAGVRVEVPTDVEVGTHDVFLVAANSLVVFGSGVIASPLDGHAQFTLTLVHHGSADELKLPIAGYSQPSHLTRGETVKNEILGSGDASIPFQTFRLKKSPLTYLASPNGPAPQLEVYVNGQQWTRAPSFYGTRPTDQIYTIRHDDAHATIITFGDGELGQRVPTGGNNVVATYRFGVGGNVPANSITTLKKPVKGIRKVFNPLPATGGKDVPPPEELRRNAPLSTLVLGRLVSLPDFEAEARQWGNVVNAKATRGWDESSDQPVVQLWVVTPDAGDPSANLRAHLEGMAEPNIALTVTKATALTRTLLLDLEVDPKRQREVVELAVANHLFHEYGGPLSLRNVSIGGRFHRSKLLAAIHEVPGVIGVNGITLDGEALPASLAIGTGQYLDCPKQLFGAE